MTSNDWLFPSPRSTPNDPAAYWPDTGFLELPQIPLTDDEIDELERRGAPTPSDLPFGTGAYLALAEHEQTHWIQAHAFSYGRFQTRLDHARTEIAESCLGLFPPDDLARLLTNRLKGDRVLSLDEAQSPQVRDEFGPVVARLQFHWWALGFLRHELDAESPVLRSAHSTRYRFGLAALYANAGPEVSRVALMDDVSLVEAALARAPSTEWMEAVTRGGFPDLTSAAIAECTAVLNQHWFYAHQAEACRRSAKQSDAERWWSTLVRSWESKELTYYSDAFTVFSKLNPSLDLNATIPLATLGVLCSVALDGRFPAEHEATARWEDIAPALRFAALARVVGKVGLLPAHSVAALLPEDYHGYVEKLADAAGIAPPAPYPAERLSPARWDTSPTNDLRRLHHDAATAATALFATLPAAIVAPAEANVYRGDDLLTPELDAHRLAREAPLLILGGVASSTGIDDERFWRCAIGGGYQRLLLQLIGDTRPLRRSGLPICDRGADIVRRVLAVAEIMLGAPIPFAH
jgi:hypothetical protein